MAYKLWAPSEVLTSADLNAFLMRQSIIKCTSGTRPTSPDEGMTIYETDTDSYRVWSGAAWVRTGAFNTELMGGGTDGNTSNITGISSTTPAIGSPICGHTFVAPPSGGVYVTVSGRINQGNNGFETLLGFQLRSGSTVGSGTIQIDYSSTRAIVCGRAVVTSGSATLTASRRCKILPGTLTPGATFNAVTLHWVTGGTGQVEHREICVEPVL